MRCCPNCMDTAKRGAGRRPISANLSFEENLACSRFGRPNVLDSPVAPGSAAAKVPQGRSDNQAGDSSPARRGKQLPVPQGRQRLQFFNMLQSHQRNTPPNYNSSNHSLFTSISHPNLKGQRPALPQPGSERVPRAQAQVTIAKAPLKPPTSIRKSLILR